jgi:hypothetical protein
MKAHCITCGKKLDCSKAGECWSDNPNALTHPHLGGLECLDCYKRWHKFCPACNDRPVDNQWSYCPYCGVKLAEWKID